MTVDPSLLKALEWRLVGPHRGGRVVAVHGHPSDPMTFYFGACAGGVWKTTDGGTTWENVSDGYFKTSAVGALAVSESDPNVIYVGTGETCIRGNVSHGDGIYKSTDGGKTWTNVGLEDTRHIASVQIHPRDPELVYVAALGHAWGPNKERGVYRSKDGGKHWDKVLFKSERTGAIDLSMDPQNPRTMYVSLWQTQRYPHRLESGGPESSLYKTTDGGDTWTEITHNPGLPKGVLGKMGIVASPAKTDRVFALIEAEDGAFFRSDDGGATWKRLSEEGGLRGRPWYYMHVFADPQDPDTCWVLDYSLWKSIDGGATFFEIPTPHGDNHDLWIDPHNPLRMIEGNDGGACITFNGGESWSTLYNQPTAQFYHVTTDNQFPYRLYGSQQDNTAISVPSASTRGVILQTDWFEPGGGESGYIAIKPDNPNIVVAGAVGSGFGNGRLIHYDHRTGHERNITVWPEVTGMGIGAAEHKYRFQWTFPIFWSRWDPNVLYTAGNRVFKSTNEGQSWEAVTPDLTRNDPERQQASGGPITKDNTGAEAYCTIFALAESPHERGVYWAGSDDGLVQISRDNMQTWQNVTPKDLPEWGLISIIEPSPHDPATAYVAATRYKVDDTKPYLFKTNDYGKSWQKITHGIPDYEFTRVIREDPNKRGLLYAGTETGVYVSFDDGEHWQRLNEPAAAKDGSTAATQTLPVTPIHDLIVKGTDLIVATHGRSFWILDDVTPLHQLSEEIAKQPAHLFKPRQTVRFKTYKGYGMKPATGVAYRMAGPVVYAYRQKELPSNEKKERLLDAGENPPDGVVVYYWLKEKPQGEITLTFSDSSGKVVHEFSSKKEPERVDDPRVEKKDEEDTEPHPTKEAGPNRFVWNLRYPEATKILGHKGRSGTDALLAGPQVAPGTYQVQLKVGDQTYSQSFELVKDPRVAATAEDLQMQFDLLKQVHGKLSETHDTILQIRHVREQANAWGKYVDGNANGEAIKQAAKKLSDELCAIEDELIQIRSEDPRSFPSRLNSRLAALASFADSADSRPPQQVYDVFEDLSKRIDAQMERYRQTLNQDIAAFNKLLRESGVDGILPKVKSDSK